MTTWRDPYLLYNFIFNVFSNQIYYFKKKGYVRLTLHLTARTDDSHATLFHNFSLFNCDFKGW